MERMNTKNEGGKCSVKDGDEGGKCCVKDGDEGGKCCVKDGDEGGKCCVKKCCSKYCDMIRKCPGAKGLLFFILLIIIMMMIGVMYKCVTKTIEVEGYASVMVSPDAASHTLHLDNSGNDIAKMLVAQQKTIDDVKAFMAKHGVSGYKYSMSFPSVTDRVTYGYSSDDIARSGRYRVEQSIYVLIDSMASNRDIVDDFANLVSGPNEDKIRFSYSMSTYFIGDFSPFQQSIMAEATENARAIAQSIAEKSGVRIKKVKRIKDSVMNVVNLRDGEQHQYKQVNGKVRIVYYVK